jgi:hypothetical protein
VGVPFFPKVAALVATAISGASILHQNNSRCGQKLRKGC